MSDGSQRGLHDLWLPAAGVDAAARAAVERGFRERVVRRARPDGESGVFAAGPIAQGAALIHRWHDEFYRGMVGWAALTVDAIDRLPPARAALFQRYGLDHDFGVIYGPLDAAFVTTLDNFINHSCAPNLGYDREGNVVARRALGPGDELLLDYGAFVVNYDEPFTCRCGSPACRTRVTRHDWRRLAATPASSLPPFVARAAALAGASDDGAGPWGSRELPHLPPRATAGPRHHGPRPPLTPSRPVTTSSPTCAAGWATPPSLAPRSALTDDDALVAAEGEAHLRGDDGSA